MKAKEVLTYLEDRLCEDGAFLLTRQNQLDVDDPEQKEIYEVTQGRIEMCRQALSYLEDIRHHPETLAELRNAA